MTTTTKPKSSAAKAREEAREAANAAHRQLIAERYAARIPTWFPCPEPGCTVFPYETQADLDAHLTSGDHAGGYAPMGTTTPRLAECDYDRHAEGCEHIPARRTAAAPAPADLATDRQLGFLTKLLAELATATDGLPHIPGEFLPALDGTLTKAAASKAIDTAKEALDAARAAAPAPAETAPAAAVRPNRYASPCATCGTTVPEGAGSLTKDGARWVVRHIECPARSEAPAPAAEATVELEPGRVYATADGRIGKVVLSKAGRLYAKARIDGGWDYQASLLAQLVRPVTAEEAAAWGHEHGSCCFCGRSLTDDGPARSVEVGYGPVCADRYGLPWG